MAHRTIREIVMLSPEDKKELYRASGLPNKTIEAVKIDNETFTDFSAFSFLMEKSFVKSPTRASDGSIGNLDSYAWFLTPHLKIDFGLLSIESYRTIMRLIQSKNEFTVTCYDPVQDKNVTHNMYFATEQMPKLWSIAKALVSGSGKREEWVELLGVQDYTIELIGTNTDVEPIAVIYDLNVPLNATWGGEINYIAETTSHITHLVGAAFNNNGERSDATDITFGNLYKFKYWCDKADGTGFKYVNGNEYLFKTDTTLFAIWEAGAT